MSDGAMVRDARSELETMARTGVGRLNKFAGCDLHRLTAPNGKLVGLMAPGADMGDAELVGANMFGAFLVGTCFAYANLHRAILREANMVGADLEGADLSGADLSKANLERASVSRTRFDGALLDGGERMVGSRPLLQIGPLGGRGAYLVAYSTDRGIRLRAGCFFGSIEEFRVKCVEMHGLSAYRHEYFAALEMVRAHERIWSSAAEEG